MDKNKICEALYALPGGAIVRRRKSLLIPIILLLAGAALIIVNDLLGKEVNNNLRSAMVFIGGVFALAGFVLVTVRLSGSGGVPYHRDMRSLLRYEEFYFDRKSWQEVVQCVNDGDVSRLRTMKHTEVPEVTIAMYTSSGDHFAAMQAFEYADLEYKPLSGLKIVDDKLKH